jgi:alkylhydroperoxidase family enzyme
MGQEVDRDVTTTGGVTMTAYLSPIERPRGLLLKTVYFFSERRMGTVPTPIKVLSARMPAAFTSFYGKISKLDKKLVLPRATAVLIREQVARTNDCQFCMDIARWDAMNRSGEDVVRMDALPEYRTSDLFTDAERAALDYATELTVSKRVAPETFARLARAYTEREICDIVWLVASEHLYNLSNHGLNIGSDGLCRLRDERVAAAR